MKYVLFALTFIAGTSYAFPKRSGTCVDNPKDVSSTMGGAENQNLGWTLSTDKNSYRAGDQVKVTVRGRGDGAKFKGLLLFARGPDNAHFGKWDGLPAGFQTLDNDCKDWGLEKSTLSHDSNAEKTTPMTFTWTADMNVGALEFRGLVVTQGKTTWQQFQPLQINGPNDGGLNGTGGANGTANGLPTADATQGSSMSVAFAAVLGTAVYLFM